IRPVITIIILGSSLAIAENVQNIGTLFSLVGGIAAASEGIPILQLKILFYSGAFLAYILPSVLYLKLEGDKLNPLKKIVNVNILIFGIVVLFGSTGTTIYEMMRGKI